MTEYSQRYSRAPHTNYNSQVYQDLENSYMPAQEPYNPVELDSTRVTNWNGHNSHASFSPVANHQVNGANGFSTNYGASMSEQPPNHINNQHRGGPNGIFVNTTNLPLSNPNITNIINTNSGRIICVADVRGNISLLNKLAEETGASVVIHTGDFGFYEKESLDRVNDRTLQHIIQYSTLIPDEVRKNVPLNELRRNIRESDDLIFSEFPYYRDRIKTLKVPVYAIWGVCEDVSILEKLRMKEYNIPNLFILDEANTYLIDVGGIRLRLFGLGGAVVQHKLFDNGEGISTIAGGQGVMWTTMLQIGELVNTAQKVYNNAETRVLVTQTSPGREGLLAQLSIVLKADFTISAGLHFRYCISYNEFSVQHDYERFRKRLEESHNSFRELWAAVGDQVESNIDISQKPLLDNALEVVNRVPTPEQREEVFFKNAWHFNLPDAAFGWLVLSIKEGRISSETRSQGFNFNYRRDASGGPVPGVPSSPPLADAHNRRQTTQWQYSTSSPALPPQQANGGTAIQSLILAHQRSTSPVASSEVHSDWKQLPPHQSHNGWVDSSSPDEITSSSQRVGVEVQDMECTPSKVNGNDIGINETVDDTSNDIINNNEITNINGFEQDDSNNIDGNQRTKSWADQAQNEDAGESSRSQVNGENLNNEDDSSNSNFSAQQNRYSYNNNNNNRRNNKHSVRVENLTPPVTEEDIKKFFAPSGCQIERVKLPRDRDSGDQLNFCFVEFQDGASLEKAIQLNGQPFGLDQTSLNIRKSEYKYHRGGGRGRGRGFRRGGGHGNNGSKQNGGPQ